MQRNPLQYIHRATKRGKTYSKRKANSMKSADYDEMLNDTYKRAREARDFAEQLEMQNERKASLFWHEMADRLYAVIEHAEGV